MLQVQVMKASKNNLKS